VIYVKQAKQRNNQSSHPIRQRKTSIAGLDLFDVIVVNPHHARIDFLFSSGERKDVANRISSADS